MPAKRFTLLIATSLAELLLVGMLAIAQQASSVAPATYPEQISAPGPRLATTG
jgi:hypothetical protein